MIEVCARVLYFYIFVPVDAVLLQIQSVLRAVMNTQLYVCTIIQMLQTQLQAVFFLNKLSLLRNNS